MRVTKETAAELRNSLVGLLKFEGTQVINRTWPLLGGKGSWGSSGKD